MSRANIKIKALILLFLVFTNTMIPAYGAFAEAVDEKKDYEYVPPADNIGSVKDIMANEARAQLAIYVLANCFAHGINRYEPWDNLKSPSIIFNVNGTDRRINTGYWMEKKLTGEASDGRVWCSEEVGEGHSIFTELLQALGLGGDNKKALFCDVDENGRVIGNGLFKTSNGSECGDESDDTEYMRNDEAEEEDDGDEQRLADHIRNYDWGKHIEKLYNRAKEKYGWYTSFGTVQSYSFPEVNGYYLYTRELETNCGSSEEYETKGSSDMDLNFVDQNSSEAANVVYRHFNSNNEFDNTFVARFSENGSTCKDIIARANENDLYGAFRRRMMATLNTMCKKSIDDRMALYPGGVPSDTQIAYDLAESNKSMFPNGQFIGAKDGGDITDETTGWVCIDIGDITGASQDDPETDDEEKVEPDCYSNAGSLGWILCPIIDQGGKFVTGIYEKMIEPFMVLDSGLFNPNDKKGGGSATYDAWSQFQAYANLAFIIVFLVVIFSQLTGYGIDNYGIKKILPKLIVSALLINLSYIICQLAIDVANIVGYGMKTVLSNIGTVNISAMSTAEAPSAHPGMAAGATAILVALVALITAGALLSKGVAILVPVFIAIIGIVIAVFTLFCILAIRKAFAVVLVVISPIAFLCYMLPNTKKIYDKWFTAFKAVLIAFPICSGMVYGGQAVARILVQSSGGSNMPFLLTLSAAVMSIAPVFLIPGTLKKSMGAISGMIDRVSRGASHRARGRVANSNISRDLQRRGQLQRSGIKVGKDGQVKYTARGKLQNRLPRTSASKQRLDAVRTDAIKSMGAMGAAGSYMGASGLDKMNAMYSSAQAAQDKQRVSDLEASYKLGNETLNGEKVEYRDLKKGGSLQKALQHAIMTGDKDRVKALSNIAAGQGDKGRSVIKNAMKEADAAATAFGDDDAGKAQMAKMTEGKQALASNIMDNYAGSFKENARSTYDWAVDNQTNGAGDRTMASYEDSVSTGSLRGSHMNNMDDDDFGALMKRKAELEAMAASGTALSNEQKADYSNILAAAAAGKTDQSFTATKIERQQGVESLSKMSDANALWDKATKEAKLEAKRNTSAWNTATESEEAYKNRIKQTLLEQTKKNLGQ